MARLLELPKLLQLLNLSLNCTRLAAVVVLTAETVAMEEVVAAGRAVGAAAVVVVPAVVFHQIH